MLFYLVVLLYMLNIFLPIFNVLSLCVIYDSFKSIMRLKLVVLIQILFTYIRELKFIYILITFIYQSLPVSSVGKDSACNAGDLGLIPGSGRSPEEGNGNPLQYSYLENPMDKGT